MRFEAIEGEAFLVLGVLHARLAQVVGDHRLELEDTA